MGTRMSILPANFIRNSTSSDAGMAGVFYAWLSWDDFQALQEPKSEEVVLRWLAKYEPEDDVNEVSMSVIDESRRSESNLEAMAYGAMSTDRDDFDDIASV